jgi:hypothetical protein
MNTDPQIVVSVPWPGSKVLIRNSTKCIYGQFCYYACFFNVKWLQSNWWVGDRCLYNANFRARVLAITRFQRPMWSYKFGWRAKIFWRDPIIIMGVSIKWGLTRKQILRYTRTACTYLKLGKLCDTMKTYKGRRGRVLLILKLCLHGVDGEVFAFYITLSLSINIYIIIGLRKTKRIFYLGRLFYKIFF